jgi:tryptophanyl-tRNA synthetase
LEKQYEGQGYGTLKKDLVEVVWESLAPIQEKYRNIRESEELLHILEDGAERAATIGAVTMKRVKDRFGLGL